MWRVQTASRLHLGLLSLPPAEEPASATSRRFGGVGLMIDSPGVTLRAVPALSWSAEGPLAARALGYARRVADASRADSPALVATPHHLIVEQAPAEHVGLGVGTQLGLAVAAVLAHSWGCAADTARLARWCGRGLRSALGVHGFAAGGFLVEGGKRAAAELSPLVARLAVPPTWRIVLIRPDPTPGVHGGREQAAFAELSMSPAVSGELCRLVLLGILPALAEADLAAFGEAVHEFNRRVGEAFAPVQGGTYSSPAVAETIHYLRRQDVHGVGQSSWGPGVFAFVADEAAAQALHQRVQTDLRHLGGAASVATPCNHGAIITQMPE